jgi:glycosyltransferase involved in cell wall biosynthesis
MSMPSFIITVNSEHYIGEYSKRFRVQDNKFFVLTDPGQPRSQLQTLITENSFVFTGGEAKRDWETLFKSCRMLPVIKFVCIARKKYFNMFLEIPQNVELLFDTDSETFYDYMRNSSIVVIPLKSLSPAGLIVLLDAAIMNKPVIITKTPSTENYIIDGQSGFLTNPENEEELTTKIQQLWDSTELQNRFAINLKNSVMANHTPQIYSTSLLSILKDNNMFPINK